MYCVCLVALTAVKVPWNPVYRAPADSPGKPVHVSARIKGITKRIEFMIDQYILILINLNAAIMYSFIHQLKH